MADTELQRDHDTGRDSGRSITDVGLRWAALRGMLGSPLMDGEEQRPLRDELLKELQSVGSTMTAISAHTATELCAKIDVLGEELKMGARDLSPSQGLLASVRRDVVLLLGRSSSAAATAAPEQRPASPPERSGVQIVRGPAPGRVAESAPGEPQRPGPAG